MTTQKPQKSPTPSQDQSASPQPWIYSEAVKDHFLHPRNFLTGDPANHDFDAEGLAGNPVCGDEMIIYIKVRDDKIKDIKWKTYGCASAIASTSALTEIAKNKPLDEAAHITPEQIEEYLGGLPKHKFHCSVLGQEALATAIENYKKSKETK